MEDDESSVVVFSCGFELGDDAPLEGRGADVDCGEPVFEIVVWAVAKRVGWVDGHFLWDIVGAGCEVYADALAGAAFAGDWVVGVGAGGECLAALEVFVDYVLWGEIHLILYSIGPIGPMGPIGPIGIFDFIGAKIVWGDKGRVQIARDLVI